MNALSKIRGDVKVSFELFPPKSRDVEPKVWAEIKRLEQLNPDFMSVTYGAGGSTQDRTLGLLRRISTRTDIRAAGHLTCVGKSREEVDAVAHAYREAGVNRIVALRGDPPGDSTQYCPHPDGYSGAIELVEGLMKIGDFDISVAAYPEGHPDSLNRQADLDNLKRKMDAGASQAITQFFFETDDYFRFVDDARAAGISAPIVPGILPVTNFTTVSKFAAMCGAHIPNWLARMFEGLEEDPNTRKLIAATVAAEQCMKLRSQGVNEFHFYTLNNADLTFAICHMMGIRRKDVPARRHKHSSPGEAASA